MENKTRYKNKGLRPLCPAAGRPSECDALADFRSIGNDMLVVMALAGVIAAFLSSYANVARRRAWEVPSVVKYARYAAWLVFAVAAYDVARRIMAPAR